MKKRVFAMLSAAALALSLALTASAADTRLEIRPPEGPVRSGEAFTVTVELTGNPGITGATLTLSYDHAQMTCTGAEAGPLLDRAMADSNPDAPAGAMVAAASPNAINGDGTLAAFSFRADTDLSSFSFGLDGRLYDEDGAAVPFAVTTRTSAAPETPSQPPEPVQTAPEPDRTPETPPVQTTPEPDRTPTAEPVQPTPTPVPERTPTTEPAQTTPSPADQPAGTGGASASPAPPDFSDIASHWAREDIRTAAARGLFGGYADGTFRPDVQVTRAQFVTVLWNLAGRPNPGGGTPFTDTDGLIENYRNAIAWAYRRGLVSGTSANTFSPYGLLTRQAAMKVLFAYHGEEGGMETLLTSVYNETYQDSGSISAWAMPGMYWAVYHEILRGNTAVTLNPGGFVTRAQLAVFMVRYTDRFPSPS